MDNFDFKDTLIKIESSKKVSQIDISLEITDCSGLIKITDVMFQGGPISTIWTYHPSEMRWSYDW